MRCQMSASSLWSTGSGRFRPATKPWSRGGSQRIADGGLPGSRPASKASGLHVASDALALGNLAGAHPEGGAVIIMGDDPWCDSTQVPADSRFLFEHLRMPVVESGDAQELKDWINLSFKLSQAAQLFIGYIVTTAQADAGGTVICRPNQFPAFNTKQRIALETRNIPVERTVLLPPRTWQKELDVPRRMAATAQAARELGINRIIPASHGPHVGAIAAGVHHHRNGPAVPRARAGRHWALGRISHPEYGAELSGRCAAAARVRRAVQDNGGHRGAAQFPGEEPARCLCSGRSSQEEAAPRWQAALRQIVPARGRWDSAGRHSRDAGAEPVGFGPVADPADPRHAGVAGGDAQRAADG